MSYSQRNFQNQPFYSIAKFENDQKDLMISQLKAENFKQDRMQKIIKNQLLIQNHQRIGELTVQIRYNILNEQKMRNELEYRNRNDQTLKTISNLRNEMDNLKSQLTEKHIENQKIKDENFAFKEITYQQLLRCFRQIK